MLINIYKAAEIINVSPKVIKAWVSTGRLSYQNSDKSLLKKSDVDRLKAERLVCISKSEACKVLNVSTEKFEYLCKEYNIAAHLNQYKTFEITDLKDEMTKLEFLNRYYLDKYNRSF
ncbi:hypothetical protein N9043_00150 [bacterium]|nr:hypothetical protein [bacterium]